MGPTGWIAAVAIAAALVAGCSSDPADPQESQPEPPATSAGSNSARILVSPSDVSSDLYGVSVSGFIIENDDGFFLCDGLDLQNSTATCVGESLEISNGEVIDPIVFVGEEGQRYSEVEVAVSGDIVDRTLTIR